MLKETEVKLELLTDIEMLKKFEDDLKLNTIFTLDSASALEILKKTSPKHIEKFKTS
jgi:hypothetical protein